MKPLKLKPICKDYIWGGSNLKTQWAKESQSDIIAESWELSCHSDGSCIVADLNSTLFDFLKDNKAYLGTNCDKFDNFPILIKLIDSASNLSIQVHPSDEYALKNEGQYGKTEMWYIVSAQPGAGVYCGFKNPLSKEEVKEHLDNGTICDVLNFIEVKAGDTLFIEAGTVHAICGGLLICEIQQNSSLTYRLYDYNRLDANGKARELHIDKSLDVINSDKSVVVNSSVRVINDRYKLLSTCKYFTVYEITGGDYIDFVGDDSFVGLNFLKPAQIKYNNRVYNANAGDTYFLPAGLGEYQIIGDANLIIKTTI